MRRLSGFVLLLLPLMAGCTGPELTTTDDSAQEAANLAAEPSCGAPLCYMLSRAQKIYLQDSTYAGFTEERRRSDGGDNLYSDLVVLRPGPNGAIDVRTESTGSEWNLLMTFGMFYRVVGTTRWNALTLPTAPSWSWKNLSFDTRFFQKRLIVSLAGDTSRVMIPSAQSENVFDYDAYVDLPNTTGADVEFGIFSVGWYALTKPDIMGYRLTVACMGADELQFGSCHSPPDPR